MNESYEPSYYEIALTGRQVLAAFVILLVCLVAAFFSGVWVGRGESAADEPVRAERPEGAPAEEGGEARPEELSFFEEEEAREPPRDLHEVARDPRPETTLRQDLEEGGAGEEAPREAAQEEGGDAGVPPREGPRDSTEASREPAPPRPRPADATPSGSLATGDVVIQVLVSSEEAKAREVLGRLEESGFRAFLSPVVDDGRTLYRVRVGPFEEEAEAERVAERLRSTLNLETWITQ